MARVTEQQIRRSARTAGIPEDLWMIVVGAESGGRTGAKSPVGARGPAQLMPRTARDLENRYGINTRTPYGNLLGGAYYLAEQIRRYKRIDLALSAYNSGPAGAEAKGQIEGYAETQNYVKSIMAKWGGKPDTPLQRGKGRVTGRPLQVVQGNPVQPDYTQEMADEEGLRDLMEGDWNPTRELGKLLKVSESAKRAQAATRSVLKQGSGPNLVQAPRQPKVSEVGGDWKKWVVVPRPQGNSSKPHSPAILQDVARLAQMAGSRLQVWDNTTHSKYTVNGNVSDHYDGYAADIPAKGARLRRLGYLALVMAGMPEKEAQKASRQGGLYNVGGYQIIFATNVGGNHHDHLHLGKRR